MMNIRNDFKVIDAIGLHARPAVYFSDIASRYQSDIEIIHNGRAAKLKSLLGPMALGITTNDTITIVCEGQDAIDAMNDISNAFTELHFAEKK